MMVLPIIEYTSTVWASHTLTNINQLEGELQDFVIMISLLSVVLREWYHL